MNKNILVDYESMTYYTIYIQHCTKCIEILIILNSWGLLNVSLSIKFQSKGIVIKELEFLSDKKRHKKTSEMYPNKRFFNMLENQYSNKAIIKAKGISEVEFEIEKTK